MNYYDYLTNFIFQEDKPDIADYIVIPGSGYGELGIKAAELYLKGYAPSVIVSGKYTTLRPSFAGPISPDKYVGKSYPTEAKFLSTVLKDCGVPEKSIILEQEATFTYENALYIRKLLSEQGMYSAEKEYKMILVCQAFHARRSLMYFQYVFPNTTFISCPAVTQGISKENWFKSEKGIDTVLGEVSRCGTQFRDMIKGKDPVWKEILG